VFPTSRLPFRPYRSFILLWGILCLGTFGVAAFPDFPGQKQIIFGCDIDYPPLSFLQDGVLVGFDIDLINEIGHQMGFRPVFRPAVWPDVINGLKSGSIHGVSGILRTIARDQFFRFSIPYISDHYALFSRAGSGINALPDLPGKRLVMLADDAAIETFIIPYGLDGGMLMVDNFSAAFSMVVSGDADYTLAPVSLGRGLLQSGEFKALVWNGRPLFSMQFRIAVQDHDRDFLADLNDVLLELSTNGFIQELRQRWRLYQAFPISSSATVSPFNLILVALGGICLASAMLLYWLIRRGTHKARLARDSLAAVLEALPVGVAWKNQDLTYSGCNSAYSAGHASSTGHGAIDLSAAGPDEVPNRLCWLDKDRAVLASGKPAVELCKSSVDPGRWVLDTRVPVPQAGLLVHCVQELNDQHRIMERLRIVTEELADARHLLEEFRTIDEFTGLFNKVFFEGRLREEAIVFKRTGRPFSIVRILVLSRQRQPMPSTDGHTGVGNQAIDLMNARLAARAIRHAVRASDIASALGIGNYAVLAPDIDARSVDGLSTRIQRQIEDQWRCEPELVPAYHLDVIHYSGQDIGTLLEILLSPLEPVLATP
jgi:polar amino acid transport system substrate-binding protein